MGEFVIMNEPKITDGSKVKIGNCTIYINKHFNWFQKKMIKWCFGFEVEDCSE